MGRIGMTIDEWQTAMAKQLGQEQGPTAWRIVHQDDITAFGHATYDPDPMHVDPDWAAANSPFGSTIAFGFWTFAMLTSFFHELQGGSNGGDYGVPHQEMIGINYGVDRLRFIQPVPVGARIRMRATLADIERKGPDRCLITNDITIDIEGEEQPALIARWLTMMLVPESGKTLDGFRRVEAL
jgi:acyl dehydratase